MLVLAPVGRDAEAIGHVLETLHLTWIGCADLPDLCARFGPDTAFAVVAEEGLAPDPGPLLACLSRQPSWSDLPILLVSAAEGRRGGSPRWLLFEHLGNVTILERPFHVGVLQAAARGALRSRARQRQTRRNLEELERSRGRLAEEVARRTEELLAEIEERTEVEQALSRAQRMEALGQLTGRVAHDFNNLLQVVVGGMSLLERRVNHERAERIIDGVKHAAERGGALTQQLLAFARRQRLAPEPVDVATQLRRMEPLLRNALRHDLRFELVLADELWPVLVDPTQLEVAVLNLVVNARDATPRDGMVTVSVENAVLSGEGEVQGLRGEFVRVEVRDTGDGMTAEARERAFEPFFTTKTMGEGTGLGLSQVYGFARQSGGQAVIDSEVGAGTSVAIFLPRSAASPEPGTASDAPGLERGGGRILLLEDDPAVARLTLEMLEDLGFDYDHVSRAEEALALPITPYVAFVTDVIMPGAMDGVAAALEIRRRAPELPILLVSGFAAPERIAEAGFPLLRKPFTERELSTALAALLRKD